MAMIKKILVPTDYSDVSVKGVRYARELAKETGAELIIMNIVTLDESNLINKREMDEHRRLLDEFVANQIAEAGSGLKIRKVVEAGRPDTTLAHWADNDGVDLIVMSSHGRSGLSRVLMGSVTEETLRKARCPVLVVPLDR